VRELEQLGSAPEAPLFVRDGSEPALQTIFAINGTRFHFDATAGQKTGAFLDQRLNYWTAMAYARGRALDVCTYQGGFALHLARSCERVTGVDASRAALEVADRNLELNKGPERLRDLTASVDWIEADAFELLRDYAMQASASTPSCLTRRVCQDETRRRRCVAWLQGAEPARAEDADRRRDAADVFLLAPVGMRSSLA